MLSRVRTSVTAGVCTALVFASTLVSAEVETRSVSYDLDIPSQSLSTALKEMAVASHYRLLYKTDLVLGKTSGAVKGNLTAEQAIEEMLAGTNLTYEITSSSVVLIKDRSSGKSDDHVRNDSDGENLSQSAAQNPSFWSRLNLAQASQVGSDGNSSVEQKDTGQASQNESAGLQEIVVTAQRRAETIDKVPVSMTAFSQAAMDDLHIENLADLGTIVPGLAIQPPSQFQDTGEVVIRGIGGLTGTSPTTQIYIDETPVAIRELGDAYSKSVYPNIFDLDHVEVLRGPQGTLFGASAMGGAIRFITPQPSTTDSSGYSKADVSYTQDGAPNYELGAAYGAPLSPGVAGFRVSAWYQALGGYIDLDDPVTGQTLLKNANRSDAYVMRPAFAVNPTDALSITAALYMNRSHDLNASSYWTALSASGSSPVPWNGSLGWDGINEPSTDELKVSSLSMKYVAEGFSLYSDTSYLDRTSSTVEDLTVLYNYGFTGSVVTPLQPNFSEYNLNNSYTHAWQQEFRVSSNQTDARFNWTAGLFYRTASQGLQQIEAQNFAALGAPSYYYQGQALSGYALFHTIDVSEAAFVDLSGELLPKLKLDAGARVEHTAVEDQSQFTTGPLNGATTNNVLPDAVANPVTPRASLTYQINPEQMVYASVAKGDRPGGGNSIGAINENPFCVANLHALGLSQAPDTFGSDSLWSYEMGVKGRGLDQRLQVEGSVYYARWSNIQTAVGLPACLNQFIANQGTAISQGFDLQLNAQITSDLKLEALVGYTHAYYPDASYSIPSTAGQSAPLVHGAGDGLSFAPPWTAAVNAEYSIDMNALWAAARSYIRFDYRYLDAPPRQDPRVANYDAQTARFPNPAYGTLNVRLGVKHDALDLSAYVNNATNSNPLLSYSFAYSNSLGTAGSPTWGVANSIMPRTFGITAIYRFR